MADFGTPPPLYGYRPNHSISDLIMMGGQERARLANAQGLLWANAISGAANAVAGGVAEHQAKKEEQQKQAKAQAEMAARDAATVAAIEGWDGQDRKTLASNLVRIHGPKDGLKMADTVFSFAQNANEPDPEKHLKTTAAGIDLFLSQSPEAQARTYPRLKAGLTPTIERMGGGLELPEEYTPDLPQQLGKASAVLHGMFGSAKTVTPVSVKPGETLVDPVTGKEVYKGATLPEKNKPLKEVDLGDRVALVDDQGNTVKSIPKGVAPSKSTAPSKPPAMGEVKAITELDTSISDAQKLQSELSKEGATGGVSKLGAMLPNVVTEVTGLGTASKQRQAMINRVKQVIGKALEGGVLRKEDELKYEKILPVIGDAPEVAKAKIDGLISMLEEKRAITLDNLEYAGRDVSKFKQRAGSSNPAAVKSDAELMRSLYGSQ